jgi:hypothetical protein
MDTSNAQVDQAASAHSGAFATASSDAKSVSNYKNSVQNIVEHNVTLESVSQAYASVFNSQAKTVNINNCGDCSNSGNPIVVAKLNLSQNIVSDLAAEAIVATISQDLSNLDATNTNTISLKQDTTSYSAGLDDVIKAIGDALAACGCAALAVYAGPILVCLIVCCFLCCSGLVGVAAMPQGGEGGVEGAPPPINTNATKAGNLKPGNFIPVKP